MKCDEEVKANMPGVRSGDTKNSQKTSVIEKLNSLSTKKKAGMQKHNAKVCEIFTNAPKRVVTSTTKPVRLKCLVYESETLTEIKSFKGKSWTLL